MGYVPIRRISASLIPTIRMRSSRGSALRQRKKRSKTANSQACNSPALRTKITRAIMTMPGIPPIRQRVASALSLCQMLCFIKQHRLRSIDQAFLSSDNFSLDTHIFPCFWINLQRVLNLTPIVAHRSFGNVHLFGNFFVLQSLDKSQL